MRMMRTMCVGWVLCLLAGCAGLNRQTSGEPRAPRLPAIFGETVVVSSPDVPAPIAVRYAFDDTSEPNLSNGAALPASSFRTDAWPGVTKENR